MMRELIALVTSFVNTSMSQSVLWHSDACRISNLEVT